MTPFEVMIAGLRVIVRMHFAPHIDEWLGLWLAMKFGAREWVQKYCAQIDGRFILELGTGHGPFNEHPLRDTDKGRGRDRVENESCATLVAKSLGIDSAPLLQRILRYVKAQDLKNIGHPRDLGNFIKNWSAMKFWRNEPAQDEMVGRWVFLALDALYYGETLRVSETPLTPGVQRALELKNPVMMSSLRMMVRLYCWAERPRANAWSAVIHRVNVTTTQAMAEARVQLKAQAQTVKLDIKGRTVRLCLIRSANPTVARVWRDRNLPTWDILVQLRPHEVRSELSSVIIIADYKRELPLAEVAAILRRKILSVKIAQGQWPADSIPTAEVLRREGDVPGCEDVYFFLGESRHKDRPPNGMILNRALTAPHLEPIIGLYLSEVDLIEAIGLGIGQLLPDRRAPKRQ